MHMAEVRKEEHQKPPIVPVGDLKVDLRKSLPLTIGDAEELKKNGIILSEIEEKPSIAYALVRYVLQKAEPTLDDEKINTHLPLHWAARIVEIIGEAQTKEEIPF